MKAEPLTIAQIFKNRVRYCVPIFQRHYVWTEEKQWQPFWEDLLSKAEERNDDNKKQYPHFMGAMVLESTGGYQTKSVQRCNVIDGQQRLTTLQIFLAALRDVAQEYEIEGIARNTKQYLFNDDVDLMEDQKTEIYKVWPTRFDRVVYSDMLLLGSLDEIRKKYNQHFPRAIRRLRKDRKKGIPTLLKAYMFFREQIVEYLRTDLDDEIQDEKELSNEDRLDQLYRAFLEDFKLVEIQLDDGDDAQVIFETLNDRGTPLLASDLIRNFIFYRTDDHDKAVELYDKHWIEYEKEFWSEETSQGRLKRSRLEFFMQHFLAAKTGQTINLIKLFQEYKNYILTQKPYSTIEEELEDIQRYSPIYQVLLFPNDDSYLAKFARALKPWDVSTVFPLVFQIMASENDDVEKEGMLSDLLSYIVRRAICNKSQKNYNKLFLRFLQLLNKTDINRAELQKILLVSKSETAVWPSNEELEEYWLKSQIYKDLSSQQRNYLLSEVEQRLHDKFSEDIEIKSRLTVERVMPYAWEEHWPMLNGDKVSTGQTSKAMANEFDLNKLVEIDAINESGQSLNERIIIREGILNTIGNLTLLTQELNSSVSKGPFSDKRTAIIEQSALALNRYFQNVDEWNEEKILERGKKLFPIGKDIWNYPDTIPSSS
jgi:uncharacterized protein with ParB-like and HNH nuclease domain